MADTYTQCKMRRGDTTQTAFIPSKFARVGEVLRINRGSQQFPSWEDGWTVETVGQTRDRDGLIGIERAYAKSGVNQQKASDDPRHRP